MAAALPQLGQEMCGHGWLRHESAQLRLVRASSAAHPRHLTHPRGKFGPPAPGSGAACSKSSSATAHSLPHKWREAVLLKDFSTWGIGGAADFLVEVDDVAELQDAIRACQTLGLRHLIIGNGSNCLFDSLGFRGCVIVNKITFKHVPEPGTYILGSGYPFNQLGVECSRDGFGGLEFASGIPGTVGGAVFMNAGAGGQETCDSLHSVQVLHACTTNGGEIHEYNRGELAFGYRKSPFQQGGPCESDVITAATFKLTPSADSRAQQIAYMDKRRKTQPLLSKSAGSVFRNPQGNQHPCLPAGALIDQAGLKGFAIGSAQVSEVHANFLINMGNCSSSEVLELIAHVKCKVKERFGTDLVEEIRYIAPCGD